MLDAATSLPELSTGLTSVREGDYKLALGNIFGGNAFLPVLFLLAILVSGKAVLPNAHPSDIYLTALGRLLTLVYMAGLLVRPAKEHARLGIDSITVLALYVVGVIGLIALPPELTSRCHSAARAPSPALPSLRRAPPSSGQASLAPGERTPGATPSTDAGQVLRPSGGFH